VKKKVTLVVLLATCIVLGYLSFIAWFAGFLLTKYLGSKTVGKPSKVRSYFIPLGKYRIHLHHWLLSSCAIIVFTVFKGLYHYSRHPQYLTQSLMFIGIGIASASWVFLLFQIITMILINILAIPEERFCLDKYGDAYREYLNRTPRWVGVPRSGR